jgi:uncharacterized SAM-binding protein YcdF (DUF218 family)
LAPDVLIIFGARVRRSGKPSPLLARRIDGALEAARGLRDPLFLVMGGGGESGTVEADVIGQTLRERAVPAEIILRERHSRDTLEQVRRAAGILGTLPGHGRVLVCTSPFHQPRCRLLLRMLGLRAEAPPMPADRPSIGSARLAYYVVREIVAIAWDGALLAGLIACQRGRLPSATCCATSIRLPSGSRK